MLPLRVWRIKNLFPFPPGKLKIFSFTLVKYYTNVLILEWRDLSSDFYGPKFLKWFVLIFLFNFLIFFKYSSIRFLSFCWLLHVQRFYSLLFWFQLHWYLWISLNKPSQVYKDIKKYWSEAYSCTQFQLNNIINKWIFVAFYTWTLISQPTILKI